LRQIFAPDAIVQGVLGKDGMEKVIGTWRELHQAFAIKLTVEEIIAEGDALAVRYTERGTFVGEFRGNKPTGKPYEVVAMEWFGVKDGKIQQRWGARDWASQARQMGIPLT
jgi:predicted ester cyclase